MKTYNRMYIRNNNTGQRFYLSRKMSNFEPWLTLEYNELDDWFSEQLKETQKHVAGDDADIVDCSGYMLVYENHMKEDS